MKWILLAASVAAFGQIPSQDWNVLRKVFPAEEAIIKPLDGKRLKGSIKSVSDTAVEVETKTGLTSVERKRVDWVSVKNFDPKANARTGALIGAGVAIFAGIISQDAKGMAAAIPIMTGGGALLGFANRRSIVIYRQFKRQGDWR